MVQFSIKVGSFSSNTVLEIPIEYTGSDTEEIIEFLWASYDRVIPVISESLEISVIRKGKEFFHTVSLDGERVSTTRIQNPLGLFGVDSVDLITDFMVEDELRKLWSDTDYISNLVQLKIQK